MNINLDTREAGQAAGLTCPECGEPLTAEGNNEQTAIGDAMGFVSDPQHVFCDICGKAEHPADLTPDWNGETGNHLSCEERDPVEVYGTPEHEAWLVEMESREP